MTSSSSMPTLPLGGSASSEHISRMNLGLMGLTWTDPSHFTPDDEAFATMRASLDAGCRLWDAGQFYGPSVDPHANLKLVKRYFDKYPEDKERVVLCVKGGVDIFGKGGYAEKSMAGMAPVTNVDTLRETLKQIRAELGSDKGGKELDLWEPARFPKAISVEEAIKMYISLRDEGLFKHLSLSEVGGETLKKAIEVSNNGIATVEVEYSPFCMEAESQGVVRICEENKIPILAYSPVGKGLLTGSVRSRDDLPKGDPRLHQDSFSPENFDHNITLADSINRIASERGATAAQICLAWILQRSPIFAPIPGTRKAAYAKENAEAGKITLDSKEVKQIDEILSQFKRKGGRYNEHARNSGSLWA
ncbi:Aldo/keto reductase [Microstroma glucosiphilum]|uniref:Aldo/keto reductase n=1 Tax=Pseudomicrostroma glucosiphilum TaxID=1684307 RepID=A0A316U3E3_9BASI|nr:Aldo/keto reductase [Pseudomicrostroma glucosiphilum]PWN19822.1 Aldo/keto reductase [Pseudomicrostroma glucosiphilum]